MNIQQWNELLADVNMDPRLDKDIEDRNYEFEKTKKRMIYVTNNIAKRLPKSSAILNIGSYLGFIDIALKRLGYNIHSVDVPEYTNDPYLSKRYADLKIPFSPYMIGTMSIPFPDEYFDGIVCMEVLEHINSNPLEFLDEIFRVLKPGGYFGLTTPNQASFVYRLKAILGMSIYEVDNFDAMKKNKDIKYWYHWHEYTLNDCKFLLGKSGFSVVHAQDITFNFIWDKYEYKEVSKRFIMAIIRLFMNIPSLRFGLFVVCQKK